ncbi:hypothetical protein PMAYCL1PPCAC_05788 [Pristionchus mayeri]|uniref:G protein-coupled receptor n=1 Tax=Pristionchus mayeri TaxID=1317129 RepID=A0AAN4ZBP7_9BILA|nr:hypothetical protein PMAYCL1PPCAC_05788 [Pristionchus mayeri]
MDRAMDLLNLAFPVIHATIFAIGFSSNIGLLLAAFFRSPRTLNTYSIMIKFGTFNDLIAVCCDFFTMQRLIPVPGNVLYLSLGPCTQISARFCYLIYCLQLGTQIYSLFVMLSSFVYRLWILHRPSPSNRKVLIGMILTSLPAVLVAALSTKNVCNRLFQGLYTLAQADDAIVRDFLQRTAPAYLSEKGALAG